VRRAGAALAVLLFSARAGAQVAGPEQGPAPEQAPPPPEPKQTHLVVRAALDGATQGLFDLRLYGAGFALGFGGETDSIELLIETRFLDLRTLDGLTALEPSVTGTIAARFGRGWRIGGGLGLAVLDVERVTAGSSLVSLGPSAEVLLGYDLGDAPDLYVEADFEGQVQADGAVPWGPALQLGLRF